jgi:phosphate-selective porin OprO/OprP
MKRNLYAVLALTAAGVLAGGPAYAEFVFGEETKGVTITSNESDLNIRVRLQPRFDYGDTVKDGATYETQGDQYLRRVRLELGGHILTKTIAYNLTLQGDKWEQAGNTNSVKVLYSYVRWLPDDAFVLTVGKEKLPYSRVSLTSSSKQLLIERPVSTEAAKKVFGSSDAYYQPKFSVGGRVAEGLFAYDIAIADGWQNGELIADVTGTLDDRTVLTSSPLVVARVELSPPGWAEKGKSDAPLGKGQHLTVGVNVASQSGIEYKTVGFEEDRTLWGFDVSGHYKAFTAQFEYNKWDIDSTDTVNSLDKKPEGWYAQAGYFIDGVNLEPVARYEVYNHDSEAANKEEKIRTVGLNWYGKGHSFKVGANWVHHEFDSGVQEVTADDSKDIYQVQAQVYF